MTAKVGFSLGNRNPDVLTCIANLSNDEVFTPPEFANRMLDLLEKTWAESNNGANIWADSTLTFLDPFTKSGVFLREITSRLVRGLELEIPDLQKRVDHILTNQVFGIGITQLTSLIARRSLYCSKWADGKHSIASSFDSSDGNIWFESIQHIWVGATEFVETADADGTPIKRGINGKCKFCGASQLTLDRGEDSETHAYAFIHTDDIKVRIAELFGENMQFDVIIGNPPYQLDDGGYGTSAAPIYQKFVDQAKALNPRLLTMIIPSRWFTGGKGLDEFRESMLTDTRIRSVDDYLSAADVFPGIGLKGGVCYFLWDRDNPGDCRVSTHFKDWPESVQTRRLREEGADVFIRFNEGLSILKKVVSVETGQSNTVGLLASKSFEQLVSSRKPFGLTTTFKGRTEGAAPGTGNRDTYPHRIISTPFIGEPGSISSETYLAMGPFDTKFQASSALSYLSCRLTRLLVLLHKPSQDTTRKVYTFVPTQTWDRIWTDEELYAKYGITDAEIEFIESVVRPMDVDLGDTDA